MSDQNPSPFPTFEESAEELYENAPCGYLTTLPDGLVVRVNRTFLEWTGFSREELVGVRRFPELLAVGSRIYHETHFAPLLAMQGTVSEIAMDVLRSDGTVLPCLVNSMQQRDDQDRPLGVRTTMFNATDRKRYERELLLARRKAEQMAKAKADLLASMSHEIRNPLNAIISATQLLARTERSERQDRYVRILQSASGSLLDLVNDILDWSKIESGRIALEARDVELRALLESVTETFSGRAEHKGIELRLEVDPAAPARILVDPVKLRQILTNLVSNAIKFTEKGSVTLGAELLEAVERRCKVGFRVVDTGIGIARDRLDRIFEEFGQADYEIGWKYGGSGLGLSISRKLLDLHGSRMMVESEVGKGSIFSFLLDLELPEGVEVAPVPIAPRAEGSSAALEGLRVLLVEDNEVNRFAVTRLLESWGVIFDEVDDGRKALQRLAEKRYDLVLMDIHMPGLDGCEAVRAIRRSDDQRIRALPVIAISASIRAWENARYDASGFTDFAGKPFEPEMLFRKMARHTGRELTDAAP